MKIETGTPAEDGRYVVFTRCQSFQVKGWLEPEIATWHGGRWHNARYVFAWSGPIPLCRWEEYKHTWSQREYDL